MNNKFKRLLAVLFSLSMVFCLMSANAWASEPRTEPTTLYIDNSDEENHFDNLAFAVSNAINGDTIQLGKNVDLSERLFVNAGANPLYDTKNRYATTTEDKSITLDLNNHDIRCGNYNIALAGGTLNITGSGTISTSSIDYAPIEIRGTGDLTKKRTLTIGKNVTLDGPCYGLNVFGSNIKDGDANNIDVTVNGTVNGMLFVLGNLNNEQNHINVVVNGTVDASEAADNDKQAHAGGKLNEEVHPGIACSGYADVTVNDGAVVKGESGIEVRAGNLTVDGGEISSTEDSFSCNANGNGMTTKGAALAIAQHTTKKNINVTINGGEFYGVKALNESNPQKNDPAPQVKLAVTSGTFRGEISTADVLNDFITGGYFSVDPSDYVDYPTYSAVPNYDDLTKTENEKPAALTDVNETYPWVVGKGSTVEFHRNDGGVDEYDTQGSRLTVEGHWCKLRTFGDNPDDKDDPALRATHVGDEVIDPDVADLLIDLKKVDGVRLGTDESGKYATWKNRTEPDNLPIDDGAIVWVPEEGGLELSANWTAKPTIESVTVEPEDFVKSFAKDDITLYEGYTEAPTFTVTATAPTVPTGCVLEYQWYSLNVIDREADPQFEQENGNTVEVEVEGADTNTFTVPANLPVGTYYYFCRVTATKQAKDTNESWWVSDRDSDDETVEGGRIWITVKKAPEKVDSNDQVEVVTESNAVDTSVNNEKGITNDGVEGSISVADANAIARGTEASGLEQDEEVQKIVDGTSDVKPTTEGNKLVVVPSITVETKGFSVEGDKKVLELDIKATYTVYETAPTNSATKAIQEGKVVNGLEKVPLDTTDKVVTLKIKLPKGFANEGETLYIKHTKETGKNAGKTFMYEANVTKDSNGNIYAEFVNPDGFSPFAVQTHPDGAPYLVNRKVPKNTLKEAVDTVLTATGTDLKIEIASNTDITAETGVAKVNKKTTFKIDAKGNSKVTKAELERLIQADSGYICTVTENSTGEFTVTFDVPGTVIVPSDPTPTTTKPAAPATPVIKEVTDKSIVVNAVAGVEYSIDGGKTWKSAKAGEATVTFDGLTPETTYTVSARVAKTDKAEASDVVTVNATTKKTETATGTDTPTPTPGPATGTDTPTPVPTPAPTNPTYDSLSSKEKKNAKAVAKALGVDNETAAQMIKEAAKLGVSIDTVKLGTKTILALKNDNDPKGADFGKLTARATKRTNKAVTLGWKKQKNADGYMIYGNVCGKKYKLLKTIKKKGTTSWTQKKLKKGTNYKYLVVAYKNVNGEKMPIAAAVVVHTNTKGGKVTVAKSLKLNKTKVTVKKGKSFTLKATEVKEDKNLKIKSHRKVKFESSNKKIAKVSSKGKITGVKKGTVTIFAYAQNGIYKTVKVTVK